MPFSGLAIAGVVRRYLQHGPLIDPVEARPPGSSPMTSNSRRPTSTRVLIRFAMWVHRPQRAEGPPGGPGGGHRHQAKPRAASAQRGDWVVLATKVTPGHQDAAQVRRQKCGPLVPATTGDSSVPLGHTGNPGRAICTLLLTPGMTGGVVTIMLAEGHAV